MNALTPRQVAFAAAYAKHGVAERAAVEAGYSKRTARGSSDRLLANAGIREEIDRLLRVASERAEISVQSVVDELKNIAFSDLRDFMEWGFDPAAPLNPQVRLKPSTMIDAVKARAIVEVTQTQHGVRIKLADKNSALEKLARYLGMFVDKVEHSGEVKTTAPVVNLTIVKPNPKAQGNG